MIDDAPGNTTHRPLAFVRVRVWAVIGPGNSGKSSTIGALISQTGRGPGGRRDILLRGGGWLVVNARRQSVQEANRDPGREMQRVEDEARTALRARGTFAYHNVLLALRSDRVNQLPLADEYLREFVQRGWELVSLVLLGEPDQYERYAHFGVPIAHLPEAAEHTAEGLKRNWVFGAVRNHFGWA